MSITLQQILDLEPCYAPDKVEALWAEHAGGRESVLPSEFVGVVPDEDAVWVLARLAPVRVAREAACDWAERALRLAGVEDERSLHVIEVSRRWSAAWSAARGAAWSAAAAAGVAARSAAYRGMLLDLVERMEVQC